MAAETILSIGAICAAIAAIGLVARGIYRFLRRVDAFLTDWNGEPARPGREARPSMPERVARVETRLTQLETNRG
jgi:predicted acylesterase/phospholipase RssA